MKQVQYQTQGVCAQTITFGIEGGNLHDVRFVGGCSGNAQGIGKLVEGMPAEEAVARLAGIRCGGRPTSCPDQLAKAIVAAQSEKA